MTSTILPRRWRRALLRVSEWGRALKLIGILVGLCAMIGLLWVFIAASAIMLLAYAAIVFLPLLVFVTAPRWLPGALGIAVGLGLAKWWGWL